LVWGGNSNSYAGPGLRAARPIAVYRSMPPAQTRSTNPMAVPPEGCTAMQVVE
jgi:hypothetical protein